ncbi:CubicO group peptidase, beta-lactamase class C family [Lentzea albidocapillata subsp. violacea]|uniref:CubicO group peptidase, beta-lactamase class C family n=1 Tax=Lentzea albidocapillata subsp. violacea TaxID=128104 RepID=A0A1G9LMB1_9PSEU|nr:serine hydrolase domain-containing protein [Lentzea albidocapillata]SDL63080.1 CubicO group peptidase, beta-lactamase class C family [Lentzea albidocapillata subsp. violacea]
MGLGELIAKYDVPGAQVAVLTGGEIRDEAAGVSSTGGQVTSDSAFRVGSITKIWTATLVQRLVDEGRLDLDRPVCRYLPGFTPSLTARHLLTHMGGLDSNHFFGIGRGDDALEKYAGALAAAEHPIPPGTVFSYSNSGFVVLGRLVEVLSGKPFHDVLRERLVEPMGLRTVATEVGHGTAPGASDFAMSARELLRFVRLHLDDPKLAVLRETQVEAVPDFGSGVLGWGLGWMLYLDGVVGHIGVAKGRKAFLRVVPDSGTAVAVLTNSADSELLAREVFTEVLKSSETPPSPATQPGAIADWMCGTYRNQLYDITLATEDERAVLVYRPRTELGRAKRVEVVRHGDSSVIGVTPTSDGYQVFSLVGEDESGRARFLHNGSAAYRITPPR